LPYKSDVIVDGHANEWSSTTLKKDKSTGVNYSVANDERNIYFILTISDASTQKQIIQNGLEIWINKYGKKEELSGVKFPMPLSKNSNTNVTAQLLQEIQTNPDKTVDTTSKKLDLEPILKQSELTLSGFLIDNGKQPIKGCPVKVAITKDSLNCLTYELAVPFNTFYKEQLESTDIKTKFYIGLIVNGVELSMDDMRNVMRMGSMMGGSGMDGHGMGGMGNSTAMKVLAATSDKILWFKTGLAVK